MSIERGKLITVHGIDGTGKSETARAVSAEALARGVRVINYDEHEAREKNPHTERKRGVDKSGSLEERLAAHLSSTLYHSENIEQLLANGYHVVKSRYLDDVMAHFSHLGVSQERINFIVQKFPIVQPDLKVILTLDEVARMERMRKRSFVTDQDIEAKVSGSRALFFEDYIKQAISRSSDSLSLDTGAMDSRAIAKVIVDRIINHV